MALSACSGSGSSAQSSGMPTDSSSASASAAEASQEEADDDIIEFENVVLVDDDVVTVELTQFFEKEVNWAGADKPSMEKYITLKVHNNSDTDILFNLEDGYVHGEGVKVIMSNGNSGPAPGKTKTYSYDIQYETTPDATPLESLDDLYSFEGTIQTYAQDGSQLSDERNTKIVIGDFVKPGESTGSGAAAASAKAEDDQEKSSSASSAAEKSEAASKTETAKPQNLKIGDTVSNDKFNIVLTDARVDSTLSSSESSTYWEPDEGAAFVILEFDVTALTSDQLPVDDYAITDLVAKYKSDTYASWTMNYINGQLWLYFRHTYLDANLPCHVYAYTSVPAAALESGDLSVDLTLAGTPYTAVIR